jgi:RNA polymerase sigma-70 factor (ECF subfamily)
LEPREGAAAVSGDDVFYETYLAPLETRMLRTAWRITHDPDRARDALQDAMARVWVRRDRVRVHPEPAALVLRITIHAAIDRLRRERRRLRAEERGAPAGWRADPPAGPATAAERSEVRALVLDAVARLPEKQAAAVTLRVLEEQPYDAIAAALGCAEPTARVHVQRGREKLKRLLRVLAPAVRKPGGEP